MNNKEIVEVLTSIKEDQDKGWGICFNLIKSELVFDQYLAVEIKMKEWPKYSGYPDYPVPSTNKTHSAEYAYDHNKLWTKRSAYGRLRHELLDWLIVEFSK